MYDVIVVGARCAGSPTAMLLARRGWRVLLVDRATFPSDAPRNHYIRTPGVRSLQRWGLLDLVIASNCTPSRTITFGWEEVMLTGTPPAADGVTSRFAPRRFVLDKILVDAAVAAGTILREGFTVENLLFEDGRVAGIRGRSHGSALVEERARIVIGADGMRSAVATAVGAAMLDARPVQSWGYYSYYSGVPLNGMQVHFRQGYTLAAFPTNDGLSCVLQQGRIEGFPAVRAAVEGNFNRLLSTVPSLGERVFAGKREERFVGSGDLQNFVRQSAGPGWALVGDAGYCKDPINAEGVGDAFRDAGLLAGAIDAGLAGRQPLDAALAEYERQRNEAARPAFDATFREANFSPSSDADLTLQKALLGNQADTDLFFGAIEGIIPDWEFFAADNIARIIGARTVEGNDNLTPASGERKNEIAPTG